MTFVQGTEMATLSVAVIYNIYFIDFTDLYALDRRYSIHGLIYDGYNISECRNVR